MTTAQRAHTLADHAPKHLVLLRREKQRCIGGRGHKLQALSHVEGCALRRRDRPTACGSPAGLRASLVPSDLSAWSGSFVGQSSMVASLCFWDKFVCLPSRRWWRSRRVGVKVAGKDGLQRRLEKELSLRPGCLSRLRFPAMQSPDLHKPLGCQDSRRRRGGRKDSRKVWL